MDDRGPAEIDQFDFEVEHEMRNNAVVLLHRLPSTLSTEANTIPSSSGTQPNPIPSTSGTQPNLLSDDSSGDELPPVRDGMCIVCMTKVADVLLFDCKHMATCQTCHSKITLVCWQ